MNEQIIEHCRKLVSDSDYRKTYLLGLKDKYRGLTGYFSNYIPEEIIAAAGFHPLRIIGSLNTSGPHLQTLFNPACSFVQDVYAAACSGEFSYLDHIIFPNSCDSLKLLYQMWESEVKEPSAYTLLHPINTDGGSIEYFAAQIKVFAEELHRNSGADFSQEEPANVIDKYNRMRGLLRQLYDIRKSNKAFLAGSDTIALMTAGLIMDRDEYHQILEQVVQEGRKQKPQQDKLSKNIMLIGPLMDNIHFLEQIEESGATIVDDDITNGTRYFDRDVQTQGDLYENLARRYLLSGPSPTLYTDPETDARLFQEKVAGPNPDGIIFINQKFCEPHVHNYLAKAEALKPMGIPILMLEVEHNRCEANERELLRIESFLEMLAVAEK